MCTFGQLCISLGQNLRRLSEYVSLVLSGGRVATCLDPCPILESMDDDVWNLDFAIHKYGSDFFARDFRGRQIFSGPTYLLGRFNLLGRKGYADQSLKLKFE